MKKEYVLLIIIGLFILAYVLDGVVNPLTIQLPSPYHYFNPQVFSTYIFTTTSIVIKGSAVTLATLWFMSFLDFSALAKGSILLVVSSLMQLYALQDVATNAQIIPLEWSLSLTLAGVVLLATSIGYIVVGVTHRAGQMISGDSDLPTGPAEHGDKDEDDFFKTL